MIEAKNIIHFYRQDRAIDGVSVEISKGEFVALTGESGSGKSTLLSILSTLLTPSSGEVIIDSMSAKDIKDINQFRREYIGFVFQFHYLIPYLSIKENITLANPKLSQDEISKLLRRLEIDDLIDKKADEISGGQRQRASIARALANSPKILFADEPTGNLDSKNSEIVFNLFREIADNGTTVVVATHDRESANIADRVINLKDGRIA